MTDIRLINIGRFMKDLIYLPRYSRLITSTLCDSNYSSGTPGSSPQVYSSGVFVLIIIYRS